MKAQNSKDNLCDICIHECIASCPAFLVDTDFGDGVGGDNVINCNWYEEQSGEL